MTEPQAEPGLDMGADDEIQKASDQVRTRAAGARPPVRRGAARSASRELPREPVRGKAQVEGRNGEVLSRRRTQTGDIFNIPPELIPQGWEYQWVAVSVVGNTEVVMDQNLMMAENGWRPVNSDRYPGRFMPVGHDGPITRGGQMLMERPVTLCEEARAEDIAMARRLITDRDQSLMGGKANVRGAMNNGFEMGGKYRGTGGDVRMQIDRALDIPMPSHQLAEPGE